MCNSVLLFVSHCFALSLPGRSCRWELVLNWPTCLNIGEKRGRGTGWSHNPCQSHLWALELHPWQVEPTYLASSSGRRFTLTFPFLFWQQNLTKADMAYQGTSGCSSLILCLKSFCPWLMQPERALKTEIMSTLGHRESLDMACSPLCKELGYFPCLLQYVLYAMFTCQTAQ